MLELHIGKKRDLYAKSSTFKCEEGCPRYGCRSDLVVSASFLDMAAQARGLGEGLRALFERAYRPAPSYGEAGLGSVRVRLTLRKPCVFLADMGLCMTYADRPAVCALFPEYLFLWPEGRRRDYITENEIASYPCLAAPAVVGPERKEALVGLLRIHETEILATEVCLFGVAGFAVDLREDAAALFGGQAALSYGEVASALERHLERTGLGEKMRQRMGALDGEGIAMLGAALSIAEGVMEQGGLRWTSILTASSWPEEGESASGLSARTSCLSPLSS